MTRKMRHAFVIPAVLLVIPAEAGIQVTGLTGWIPAPHGGSSLDLRGDKFTPAGMTVAGMTVPGLL